MNWCRIYVKATISFINRPPIRLLVCTNLNYSVPWQLNEIVQYNINTDFDTQFLGTVTMNRNENATLTWPNILSQTCKRTFSEIIYGLPEAGPLQNNDSAQNFAIFCHPLTQYTLGVNRLFHLLVGSSGRIFRDINRLYQT